MAEVTNWTTTTIDGKEYLVVEVAQFRIPLDWDPSSNMFFAVAVPDGGLGNFPALVKGDTGDTPSIDSTVVTVPLTYDDVTADAASFSEISANLFRLTMTNRQGPPGELGPFDLMDADDVSGTAAAGDILVVNATADGFDYTTQPVGDMYWPASISNTPSGNAAYTLCSVSIPAQDFDWRPEVDGWCVVTGTGADVQVDLIARLDNATSGNIVGRGRGHVGENTEGFSTVLSSGPPAGSADAYNKIAAGAGPTVVYLRAERQSGANTFTTTSAATAFKVRVAPVP